MFMSGPQCGCGGPQFNTGFGMPGMGGFPGMGGGFGMQNPMMQMMSMMMQLMQIMMGQMMGQMGGGFPGGMGGFPGMGGGMPGMDPFGGFGNQMGSGFGFPGAGGNFGGGMPFPSYGGAPGYGGNFGGPQPSWGANPSLPMAGPGNFGGNSAFGNRLAADAQQIASSGIAGRGSNCKRGVRMALERQGMNLGGLSAYQAADQLARNPRFREVQVPTDQLRSLPPGAIVVWDRKAGKPHGHISIALGNGREASDVIRNQITGYGSRHRVFLPN